MKPLFVKRPLAWLMVMVLVVVVGAVMAGAGLWQAPQEKTVDKGGGGSDTQAEAVRPPAPQITGKSTVTAEPQGTASAKQNGFFVQYRLERDRTRSQQIDLFREIVNNQNSPEETRKEAQRRLLAITQAMDTEMKLENLIKAENFKDAVVFVQDKGVTVIVETPVLTIPDKERLTSITIKATGFSQDNVVIIAKQ